MKKNNLNEEINRIKKMMKSINEDEYNSGYNEFGYDFSPNDDFVDNNFIDEKDLPDEVFWDIVGPLDKISIHDESRHVKGWSQKENRFFEASGDFSLDELVALHDIEEISREEYDKL